MSTKNEKIESYCAVISSSWVNGSLAVTHEPLTHFHLWFVPLKCEKIDFMISWLNWSTRSISRST